MALGTGTRDTNDPQGGTEKGLPRIKPENCASTGTCCHRLVNSHFQSIKGEETDKNKIIQKPTKQNPLFSFPDPDFLRAGTGHIWTQHMLYCPPVAGPGPTKQRHTAFG